MAHALLKDELWHADGKSVDVARKDMWVLMQAAAKPELRKVFAAMHSRPCWLDTGKHCVAIDTQTPTQDHIGDPVHAWKIRGG